MRTWTSFRPAAGVAITAVALAITPVEPAAAHGLAGKRFFPATLVVDDPFVADELGFPTVAHQEPGAR